MGYPLHDDGFDGCPVVSLERSPACISLGILPSRSDISNHNFRPQKETKCTRSKGGAADALKICAVGIQLAGSSCEIVREQNEAFRLESARDVDLLHCRLRRYSIRTDSSPYMTIHTVRRSGCDFDLFLKNCRVSRVGHRTRYVEDSHLQPTAPILKATCVSVLIICENGGRN